MRKQFKKEKGVSLIALVVTIIILLILAGISIGMLTGENGLINQAANSKEETNRKGATEAVANAKDKDGKQIYPMAIKTNETDYIGVLYDFKDSTTEDKVEITPLKKWMPKYSESGDYNREPDIVSDATYADGD